MSTQEQYIPRARDARIAYTGYTAEHRYRAYCVRCHDETPLLDAQPLFGIDRGQASRSAGADDPYAQLMACAHDAVALATRIAALAPGDIREYDVHCPEGCDRCGTSWLILSVCCDREHEDQQARWAREARGHTPLIEYGIVSEPRCRVY